MKCWILFITLGLISVANGAATTSGRINCDGWLGSYWIPPDDRLIWEDELVPFNGSWSAVLGNGSVGIGEFSGSFTAGGYGALETEAEDKTIYYKLGNGAAGRVSGDIDSQVYIDAPGYVTVSAEAHITLGIDFTFERVLADGYSLAASSVCGVSNQFSSPTYANFSYQLFSNGYESQSYNEQEYISLPIILNA